MYRQSRVYIKTALVYLLLSALLGGALLLNQAWALDVRIWALLPVYYHTLAVGWLTQLIAGVALWMFPALSRTRPRGDPRLGWLAYAALNGGLLVRVVAEPWHAWQPKSLAGYALAVSALLQVAAIWALVALLWPRVRGRTQSRERSGAQEAG